MPGAISCPAPPCAGSTSTTAEPERGYGNVFNVVGLQRRYLALILAATVVNLAISVALVGPFGLTGVAFGSLAGFALLALSLLVAGTLTLRRLRAGRRGMVAGMQEDPE